MRVRIKKTGQEGVVVDSRKRQWSLNIVIYDILLDSGKSVVAERNEIDVLDSESNS